MMANLMEDALAKGVGAPDQKAAVNPTQALQELANGDPREMLSGFVVGRSVFLMRALMDAYDALRPTPLDRTRAGECLRRMETLAHVYEKMPTKITARQKKYFELWLDYAVSAIMVRHLVKIFAKRDENGPAPAAAPIGEQGDLAVPTAAATTGSTPETDEAQQCQACQQ